MRWRVETKKFTPPDGALRYRFKFAWLPVITGLGWPYSQKIWLEKVLEVQKYYGASLGWVHYDWYPINELTMSLYEHNNQ